MLSKDKNELITRIGPNTPMGDMLREYWVPACRSAKLEADGAPERIRLFGENFVAFRATDGRVGFIAEGCPHRCASMALARNEGNGLRCIFHGWKANVDGECVDAPTEPEERRAAFAKKVPVRHHPVREAGGLLWVYLGKQKTPPRFPDFEFTNLPESHVAPRRGVIHCNWLQGLEALLDSAHVSFLHISNLNSVGGRSVFKVESDYMLNNTSPKFEFVAKPYGFREGALRDQDNGRCYARIREVALPFFSFIPATPGGPALACCSIPIDDEWTAQWYIGFNVYGPMARESRMGPYVRDSGDPDFFNSDMGNRDNIWNQDRKAMKDGHWTGIVGRGNAYEDFIVQESMGPIVDRSKEHLGSCDLVILRARSMLLRAVEHYKKTGEISFAGQDVDFQRIRAISFAFPQGEDWKAIDSFNPPALEVV